MKSARRDGRFPLARVVRAALSGAVLMAAALGIASGGRIAKTAADLVASVQLFPLLAGSLRAAVGAAIGLSVAAISSAAILAAVVLALSAFLGRWYCAFLCTIGALQDLASFLGRRKRRFKASRNAIRAVTFVSSLALGLAGAMALAALVDPWSIFGRFMSDVVRPLADLAARKDLHGITAWGVAIPAISMGAVIAMAILRGRWFCGTLCPVGSVLGFLNRFAPLRIRLDQSACVSCGACAARCPASCVDADGKRLDASRCVDCLACLDACPTKAIRYGLRTKNAGPEGIDGSRRKFLLSLGGGAAALALAALPGKALASAALPAPRQALPPGAGSKKRFLESCVACGLCASACPSKVLQPALGHLGLRGLFVPRLDFSVSYCQYECKACSDSCPSGALAKMSLERKKLARIGKAGLSLERCIVIVKGTRCGACAEHCPTGAVHMVPGKTGLPEPALATALCIGCGACHHACPAKPVRAIAVSGLDIQEIAEEPAPPDNAGAAGGGSETSSGDFPF